MTKNPPFYDTPIHDSRTPGIDLRGAEWFDGDNEGPYSLQEVEKMVSMDPGRAREFHVTGKPHLYYGILLPARLAALRKSDPRAS